ncbi:phosphate ABC transporter substrate-binding protein [Flavobacterium psychrophilum]|uniref:phosphate ABC transporter substrate-binding protein n=1 Tax=Flavobacterium psychrophilum TaxID=96345 RepID=UPI0004F8C6E5|nr:phosphate ABC transporter substrate-binding protein [Flavobacterium psychrophilum]AIN73269.1 phosphate-binding protein [Flavobacterium psychrophilum FPG3]EKT2069618.1 phosphate ABC transporter substrate-binding protein [Flavobacterium psychrophilum]EKT2071878.1 phosphate ABC transporter substrate-binding protein [Flavobacterium psychrophilum]EKT4491400.1 phosphate ABC transporter substrate-binding protein [Flavobacterium psychrophilum]MBF2043852.1 phosphate ABC transporter substrate-binding
MKTSNIKLAAILLVVMTIGFSFTTVNKITIKGSDTMVILAQKWAEVYMSKSPSTAIQVTGGGSGVGLSALINGSTDIATSSRPLKQSELEKIKGRYGTLGVEIACAKDGITIYLNKANGVSELTLKELSDIYSGKITNWNQVGGANANIKLYGRENSSGTYVYFKDNVIKKDYALTCQSLPGTAAIVNAVKKDKNGIGYGGAAFDSGVKDCKVKKEANSPALLATEETIRNKTYPITRYLYLYLATRPTGETKKFVDWVLSTEGQKITSQVGYFPVK